MKQRLIIFYRNPELGKVKSRLAATLGEERALAIYLLMAAHTMEVVSKVSVDRVVYYSQHIEAEDHWLNADFQKRSQRGDELGERMKNAFEESFMAGYDSVCIIGTDCLELSVEILVKAFEALKDHDTVIGPAADGGYYLLGMNKFIPELFDHKKWSTDSVYEDTIMNLMEYNCSFTILPKLHDVDNAVDLPLQLR